MPDWADSPADWEAILAVLISASLLLGWVIRAAVRKNMDELQSLKEQLHPNHGSSLRDAVDRIESKLDHHIDWHMDRDR